MHVQNNCYRHAGIFQIYILSDEISLDSEFKPVAYINNKRSTSN